MILPRKPLRLSSISICNKENPNIETNRPTDLGQVQTKPPVADPWLKPTSRTLQFSKLR